MVDYECKSITKNNVASGCIARCVSAVGVAVKKGITRLAESMGFRPRMPLSFRERLKSVLSSEAEKGVPVFDTSERMYLLNVLRLREISVEDIMVPRLEVDAVSADISLNDLMLFIAQSSHSRIPVYKDSLDDAESIVHIRDIISHIVNVGMVEGGVLDFSWVDRSVRLIDSGMMRPVLSVPGSVPIIDLLIRMQAERMQIALVIDEFGGVDGLVSIEDIMEKVFGNIEDEYDSEEV